MKLFNAFGKTTILAILFAVAFGVNAFALSAVAVIGSCVAGIAVTEFGHTGTFRMFHNGLGFRAEITTTDLVNEFGAFYINQKQNMASLLQKLRMKSATSELAQLAITENTTYRRSKSTLGSIVQAFQKTFTEKGTVGFEPKTIDLFRMKIDMALYPDDIVETWVGFLADYARKNGLKEAQARATWPLIRYIIEMDIIPQMHDDLERLEYYKGEYQAPTSGVAGVTGNSMNGLRYLLKQGLASHGGDGSITELSDWAGVSSSNIFDKAESVIDQLSVEMEGVPLIMAMSPKNKRAYLRDKRNTHGTDVNYDPNKLTIDFYDNCKIAGLPSMTGTDDLFITVDKNFKYIRRSEKKNTMPKVEELKREVFLMTDWWEGLGFELNELVLGYVEPESSASGSASAS